MKLLRDLILIQESKPDEGERTTASGIILTSKQPSTAMGIVLGVGPEVGDTVKIGESVLLPDYGFDRIKITGVAYLIGSVKGVLAVL